MNVLDDAGYRFCHEAGAQGPDTRAWCEVLAEAPPDACPGMRETCAGATSLDPLTCAADACAPPTGLPGGAPEPPVTWGEGCSQDEAGCNADRDAGLDVPLWLRWGLALAVVLLVLAVARGIARFLGAMDRPTLPSAAPAAPVDDLPDRPAPDLLAEAEAARAAGRFDEAVARCRFAALRALGDGGHLKLHRARTDRDYARDLRRDPPRSALLAIVLARAESVQWARRAATATEADAALGAARSLLGLAVLLLVATPAWGADRWAPDGDAALYALLDEGWRVDGRPVAWDRLGPDDHLVVLDARRILLDPADAEAARDWVGGGGILWVIGDPPVGLDHVVLPSQPVRQDLTVFHDVALAPHLPDGPARAFVTFADGMAAPAHAAWWIEPRDVDDPVRCTLSEPCGVVADGYLAPVATFLCEGRGAIGFVADPRAFANAAFVDPHNARAVLQLLRSPSPTCDIALPLVPVARIASSTSSDIRPLDALRSARLLPAVLQLLVGWTVMVWSLGVPFGPTRPQVDDARRAFVDHLRALANRWRRTRATAWPLSRLAAWWLARRGVDGLQRAAQSAGWSSERFARHLAAWRAAAASRAADAATDLEHMEALWTLIRRPTTTSRSSPTTSSVPRKP